MDELNAIPPHLLAMSNLVQTAINAGFAKLRTYIYALVEFWQHYALSLMMAPCEA